MYCIIAGITDGTTDVFRANCVDTEAEAIRIVDRLKGQAPTKQRFDEMQAIMDDVNESEGQKNWADKERYALPEAKHAPDTYYVTMPMPGGVCDLFIKNVEFWEANLAAKSVSFSTVKYDAHILAGHMKELRFERDRLLLESDNDIHPDRWDTMSTADKTKWTAYRQELRDLPATEGDPANPTWPSAPE